MGDRLPPLGQSAPARPPLRCRLLGPPCVEWDSTALAIPRRSVRALLYRLACASQPVSRGHLHLLFWPDVPETLARRNLSHLLTHLRRALPVPHILVARGDGVCLEPSQVWCDVLELKEADFDSTTDASHLRHWVSLYHGPFLEGFDLPSCPEFEHWCLRTRSTLEQQVLRILESLVDRYISAGEVSRAVECAQRYLEIDPLSETIHRRLIQLFAATGARHLALQQFAHCSSVLQADLGVRPLPETQAIYQAVLQGEIQLPQPPALPPVPQLAGSQIPILGRDDELERLDGVFLGLQAGQGRVVLISGEPGIGKSRLLEEFARRHQDEANVLAGDGHAGEQAIPYQPLLGPLRILLGLEKTPATWLECTPSVGQPLPDFVEPFWLSEVSRLFPEMPFVYPDLPLPSSLEPESARSRLFDALSHLILSYAEARGPVLLCLDNLQWVDATTRAWLVHIGHLLADGGHSLLVVGAYRSEEAGEVLDLRHALARAGVLSEFSLSGLQEASILALLHYLVGPCTGDAQLASRLHQSTGGNPFYLIETLHELVEAGQMEDYLQRPMQFPLPQTVREAVQWRLQRLSPIARQVLEAGAVLGYSFGIDLLRLTAGRSHPEVLSAIEELAARILWVETTSGVRFVHEIICQHVEESLGEARSQLLHRRAGRAHERLDPQAFAVLAHYLERGGRLDKALHYHRLAASKAQGVFAWGVAELHQGQALELLVRIDPDGQQPDLVRQRAEALAERAYARHLQDRPAERDADLGTLAELGESTQDDDVLLLAIMNRLRYLNLNGVYARAIAVAREGLALLESSPTLARKPDQAHLAQSRLLAQLGLAYDSLGQPLEALRALEQAWGLCGEGAGPEARGRILHILGSVHHHLGDPVQALECQQQAYAYHAEIGDYHRIAWDLVDIGALHRSLGNLAQAKRFLDEGLEVARRVGSQQAQAYALAQWGGLDLYQGDYAAAAVHYQQAVAMQPGTHSEDSLAMPEAGVGLALYHLGDYAQSRHWLERALAHARESGHRRCAAEILVELGMLDTAEGRWPLARQRLVQGLALARDCRSRECLAAGLATLARLDRLTGNPARALELAGEAIHTARQIHLTSCEMWGEIEAGLARLALGDPSAAFEHTQRAARWAPQADQAWIGCEDAYRAHACVLRALSQDEAAEHYEGCAREAIEAKANRIPDPAQRRRYVGKSHQSSIPSP
jgi:DNA-binding SARP family transcriptional activator/tetratricopeptide (TPR) repeat protein